MDYSQFSLRGSRRHLQKEDGGRRRRRVVAKTWYGGDDEVEEVDYWCTTAGWATGDASMIQYNHAVYNRIY